MGQNEIYKYMCLVLLAIAAAILGIMYYVRQPLEKPLDFVEIRANLKAAFPDERNNAVFDDLEMVIKTYYMKDQTEDGADSQEHEEDADEITDSFEESCDERNNAATIDSVSGSTGPQDEFDNADVKGVTESFLNGYNDENKGDIPLKKYDINQYSSKKLVEQVLRDSVDRHHRKNFIKPENENCERRFPACIVLGVAKSGTRELMDFMRLHPHIEISWRNATYENPYFGAKYFKGPEWLKNEMPCSYSNQITVMKNAWYFHNQYVPKKIQSFNESVKLIVIVREPVSRAISQYSFFHKNAGSIGKPYDDVVLTGNDVNSNIPSLQLSIYDRPMKHWLQYFKLNQFLILESNELKTAPAQAVRKVENFLGLGHYVTDDMFVFNKEKGFYCIQSDLTTNGMACYAQDRGREQIKPDPNTIRKLKKYFRPHNENFFKFIGKSFDWDW